METTDILLGVTLPPLATILQYYKEQAAFSSPSDLALETNNSYDLSLGLSGLILY